MPAGEDPGVVHKDEGQRTAPPFDLYRFLQRSSAWIPRPLYPVFGKRAASRMKAHSTYTTTQKSIENLDRCSPDLAFSATKICRAVTLFKVTQPLTGPTGQRRLVLFFAWLAAKSRHIEKYVKLITDLGVDVLVVRLIPSDLLRPVTGTQVAAEGVCNFLRKECQSYDQYMVYGCSGGGYMCCEVSIKAHKDPHLMTSVFSKILGHLYDSPVDFCHVHTAISHAVTTSPVGQTVVGHFFNWMMKVRHEAMTKHMLAASHRMHESPVSAAALIMFSNSDPMSPLDVNEIIANKWRQKGLKVRMSTYHHADTGHCVNFLRYPQKYKEDVYNFFKEVGFIEGDRIEELLAAEC